MSQEKTEQPSPRRLRQAREQGDSPVSPALSQAIGFIAALAILPAAAGAAVSQFHSLLQPAIAGRILAPVEVARSIVELVLPVLLVAGAASLVFSLAQSGGNIALGRIGAKLERLDPFQGIKNLFSGPRVFSVLRALLGASLAAWLAFLILRSALPSVAHSSGELAPALALAGETSQKLLRDAAILGLLVGLVDWVVVRRSWRKRWMMSRDEAKREYRESEGDPELRAARRRAHQEALFATTLAQVKDASVVIVNPTHLATALRYEDSEEAAPRVVASGQGEFARRILEAAHQYGIPVVHDVPVARALAELEIGDEIPEALYEAVAEILREVWESEGDQER